MAKIVFGMNLSLDGYVDHQEFAPGSELFRHFIEQVRGLTGSVYGRRMYEVMRYWDEDRPEWDAEERDFAAAWRKQPKWVVSRSLALVGPNATLVDDDVETVIRGLKACSSLGRLKLAVPTRPASAARQYALSSKCTPRNTLKRNAFQCVPSVTALSRKERYNSCREKQRTRDGGFPCVSL